MTADEAAIANRYGFTKPFNEQRDLPPHEIFPRKPAYVIREAGGGRRVDTMAWGFPIAITGKTGKPIQKDVTNVRNYTSPFWRSALSNPERRCLVPFTAFSEYGQVRGSDGKLPLHWFDVPSQPITSFAGIWRPIEGGAVFAFLTCEPNPMVAAVHPKAMPVLLHAQDEERWLTAPMIDALELAAPFPSQLMHVA